MIASSSSRMNGQETVAQYVTLCSSPLLAGPEDGGAIIHGARSPVLWRQLPNRWVKRPTGANDAASRPTRHEATSAESALATRAASAAIARHHKNFDACEDRNVKWVRAPLRRALWRVPTRWQLHAVPTCLRCKHGSSNELHVVSTLNGNFVILWSAKY